MRPYIVTSMRLNGDTTHVSVSGHDMQPGAGQWEVGRFEADTQVGTPRSRGELVRYLVEALRRTANLIEAQGLDFERMPGQVDAVQGEPTPPAGTPAV